MISEDVVAGPHTHDHSRLTEVAQAAVRHVLQCALAQVRAVVVQSPPGAGKTDLVEKLAAQEVGRLRGRCVVVTQTNRQALELAIRLSAHYTRVPVTLFCRDGLVLPSDLGDASSRGNLQVLKDADVISPDPVVVIANSKMLGMSKLQAGAFDLMIVDEAWQLRDLEFMSLSSLARRVVMVGDPGQIDPITSVDVSEWRGNPTGPQAPAPVALMTRHPETTRVSLPVTRRLVDDTATLLQPIFYPELPFAALDTAASRALSFTRPCTWSPLDTALDGMASGQSLAALQLRAGPTVRDDADVAATLVALIRRLLERGARIGGAGVHQTLTPDRIGVVCGHREQVLAVDARLDTGLRDVVLVETANRYQGLERDVMLVWHPLSGQAKPSAFHVDAGRFCVMLSRHRAACLVIGRTGIGAALDRYRMGEPPPLATAVDPEYTGWRAHRRLLRALDRGGRVHRLVPVTTQGDHE